MSDEITQVKAGFAKTIVHLKEEFSRVQTGRASASLIEGVMVEAYGQSQPLKAVAGISVQDGRTLVVQPWDQGTIGDIEKALTIADLGTSPVNEGAQIRIVLPPMTEERRIHITKHVHEIAEEAKVSIRQQRHDHHKNAKKDEGRSEDEHRDFEADLQKAVDEANKEIDEITKKKEEEVMTV